MQSYLTLLTFDYNVGGLQISVNIPVLAKDPHPSCNPAFFYYFFFPAICTCDTSKLGATWFHLCKYCT